MASLARHGALAARLAGEVPLPGWATPLAIGSLGMLLVQSFDHQYVRGSLGWSLFLFVALLMLFAGLYWAIAHPNDAWVPARKRLGTAVLIAVLAGDTLIHGVVVVPHLLQINRYSTDAAAATDCATQMVLHGENPYRNLHMLTCLDDHGLHFSQTTPKTAGAFFRPKRFVTFWAPDTATVNWVMYTVYRQDLEKERADRHYPYRYAAPEFEERFNYPGGAILFGVLGWLVGMRDLVALYLTCAVAASLWIYRRANPRIRTAIGVLLLADLPLLIDSTNGVTDVLYALILIFYWHFRERALIAGMLLGLAMATRQQAWFFAPFLLYLGWRTAGWADLRRRLAPAALVFLACNAPFLLQSPSDWLAGVLGPMRDPLFAQGIGVVSIAIAVFKQHPGSPLLYGALEVLAFVLVFRYFMRRCLTAPGLALLLPLLPIALAWRSLHTYFVVLPLLAIAVLAHPARTQAPSREDASGHADLRPAA